MTGLSTYETLLDLADRASTAYDKEIDGSPEDFIVWVLNWYTGADCPEPINYPHYQLIIKEHQTLLRKEIKKAIKRLEVKLKEFEE